MPPETGEPTESESWDPRNPDSKYTDSKKPKSEYPEPEYPEPKNPFAPPSSAVYLEPQAATASPQTRAHRSLKFCLMIWALVCTVSAAPSFIWGLNTIATDQAIAMLIGVSIFIAGYTLLDFLTQDYRWRQSPTTRLTLKFGYATRMIISVIIPVGGTLDVVCGVFSVQLSQLILPAAIAGNWEQMESDSVGFLGALVITLVQGCLLNLVLAAYMLVVFVVIFGIRRLRAA